MLEKTPDFHHFSHVQKDRLFAMAFFGEFESAAELGLAAIDTISHVLNGQYSTIMARFVTSLSCFVMAGKTKKQKYFKAAVAHLETIEKWFERGNPNCQHYLTFLKAEKAAYQGKKDKALSLYDTTILAAGRAGYNHERALACERLAAYYVTLGDKISAMNQFDDALKLYEEWGANKKVLLLSEHMKNLSL